MGYTENNKLEKQNITFLVITINVTDLNYPIKR